VTAGTIVELRVPSTARDAALWGRAVVLTLPFLAVVGVASASGGFNATSFGWAAIAFAWVVIVAVTLTAPRWGELDLAWIGAALAVCIYTFASAAWSGSAAVAVNDGQRSLEYLTAVVASLLIVRRGRLSLWLGGLALGAAAVSVYSLATRLFPGHFSAPDPVANGRLYAPIGYWNALGVFAGIGALVAFGVAVAGRGRILRVAAATAIVPLAPTLYFTFSRGAAWSVALGLAATFALSPSRLRLLAALVLLAPLPAVAVAIASHASALTGQSATMSAATHAGHTYAAELVVLSAAQALVGTVYATWLSRLRVGRSMRRAAGAAAVAGTLFVLIGGSAVYGAPPTLARHAYDSFFSTPTRANDLNSRLLSLSNDGRIVLWRSALDDFRAHPIAGSGAGSFGRWWLAHRRSDFFVEDAHSLYVQTLAEGGLIGFGLLAVLLAIPVLAAIRARAHPLVAAAFGAYVVFLAHAGVDWDWQMPAVTLLALFAGAAVVAAARGREPRFAVGVPLRVALGLTAGLAALVAFVGLVGNIALATAEAGVPTGTGRKAVSQADKAHRWAPWSAVALRVLGETKVVAGEERAGLRALRESAAKDPGDWQTWYDIALVATGGERRAAIAHARKLNPYGPELERLKGHP
jgi:O-Antigen ligase